MFRKFKKKRGKKGSKIILLVQKRKKNIWDCPSEGVGIGVSSLPHTHHTLTTTPTEMAQHLPRITPTYNPPCTAMKVWSWTMDGEDKTSGGDKTPDVGMKPWMWGWNPSVGRIMVPSMNCLQSPVWRLSACLESGIIYDIHFIMQKPVKDTIEVKTWKFQSAPNHVVTPS